MLIAFMKAALLICGLVALLSIHVKLNLGMLFATARPNDNFSVDVSFEMLSAPVCFGLFYLLHVMPWPV